MVVVGAQEAASVIPEKSKEYECSCGFKLQISGDVAMNDNYNIIAAGTKIYTCPICRGAIDIEEIKGG